MASTEDFQRAGLYDPAIDAATGRIELLNWLTEKGFSVEEMVQALHEGGLGALVGDRRLVAGTRLSDGQAIALTGLSAEELHTIATAFGYAPRIAPGSANSSASASASANSIPNSIPNSIHSPSDFGMTEAEAQALVVFSVAGAFFSDEEALGFVRVVGTAMARIAEAVVALFLTDIEGPYLEGHSNELELAQKGLRAVELLDDFVPLLDPVLRRHILQAIERSRMTMISEQERLEYRYAVGFIDLVGFTPMSQEMSARELGGFIREFEGRAHDVITAAGARLVKLIGDEVMFVAPNPDSAYRVAEALMSGFTGANGRDAVPRGGMSYGEVLVRGGDYYGGMVNLASRLADQAAAGELLVTERFAAGASMAEFAAAGQRTLKGFADPVAVRSLLFEHAVSAGESNGSSG